MADTKIINIKDLKRPAQVVIIIGEDRHEMKTASVNDFLKNIEIIERLSTNASPRAEMLAMVEIITNAFPTLTAEVVREWPLDYISQLSDLARGVGGEIVTTDEAEAATGNVQAAS